MALLLVFIWHYHEGHLSPPDLGTDWKHLARELFWKSPSKLSEKPSLNVCEAVSSSSLLFEICRTECRCDFHQVIWCVVNIINNCNIQLKGDQHRCDGIMESDFPSPQVPWVCLRETRMGERENSFSFVSSYMDLGDELNP